MSESSGKICGGILLLFGILTAVVGNPGEPTDFTLWASVIVAVIGVVFYFAGPLVARIKHAVPSILVLCACLFLAVLIVREPRQRVAEKPAKQDLSAGKVVSREQFGDDWPLTVSPVTVKCIRIRNGARAYVVEHDHVLFAINGTASLDFLDLDPIWRDDPSNPGGKVSISPLIEIASTLCD